MTTQLRAGRAWPRQRLLVRSILSATLPVGWTWAAITALIPYFLIGHGPGSSAATVFGLGRATWMSLHVWTTIAMVLLTIAHVALNRRGVARSFRILSGAPNKASSTPPGARGYAWLGAAMLVVITTVGGFAFAAVDGTHPDGNGGTRDGDTAQVESVSRHPGPQAGRGGGRR